MDPSRISQLKEITPALLDWYDQNGRSLPWRKKKGSSSLPDPYHVWISEIMLQQTRVEAVKGYYARFMEHFPDTGRVAAAPEEELMKLWQGLGYYNRAKNIQKTARIIQEKYQGHFPSGYEQLLSLPGIGEYTAGAISSIAFAEPVPAVDGNVYRIYTRFFGDRSDITRSLFKKELRQQMLEVIPAEDPGRFNQAWMDLGAVICLPNGTPLCQECPLQAKCIAHSDLSWSDLPVKPAKKQRQIQERTVVLLEYQGKYLLQKRPEKGLLASLWEFPAREGLLTQKSIGQLLRQWNIPDCQIEPLGRSAHIFSHIEWHMLGYLIHLKTMPEITFSGENTWVTVEKMQREYSIPSALRYYYSKLL